MKRICLVNGQHTTPEYAKECPVLQAKRRAERRQQGRATSSEAGAAISLQGTLLERPPARTSLVDSDRLMSPASVASVVHKGGRPQKHQDRQTAHREAQRAYRDRRKQSTTQPHEE